MNTQYVKTKNRMNATRCDNITTIPSNNLIVSSSYRPSSFPFPEAIKNSNIDIDWSFVCRDSVLTYQDIIDNEDHMCWWFLGIYQKLSVDILKKYKNNFNWYDIFRYQDLSDIYYSYDIDEEEKKIKNIKRHIDYVDKDLLYETCDNYHKKDWESLLHHQYVPEEFIFDKMTEVFTLEEIVTYQILSEERIDKLIAENKDNLSVMEQISLHQIISDELIDKYPEYIEWEFVHTTNEDLLMKYKDYVDWKWVTTNADKFSKEFLLEMKDYLYLGALYAYHPNLFPLIDE